MPLTLITGPVNAGKTTYLLNLLKDAIKKGTAFYVVPNEAIAAELRRAFLMGLPESIGALMGEVFVGIGSFMKLIAGIHEPPLSPHQLTLICYRLFMTQKLRYFQKTGITFGIAREAFETISVLKRNFITPTKLRDMLKTRGTPKENDLLILYEHYEEEIKRTGASDSGNISGIAAQRLAQGNISGLSDASLIIFDEFFAPEPGVVEIAGLLRKAIPQANIVFSLPKADNPDHAFSVLGGRSIHTVLKIADEHEEFKTLYPQEPTVTALSLRSSLQEIRFLVDELEGEPHDEPIETIVCLRQGMPIGWELLSEISGRYCAHDIPRYAHDPNTPILASLIEGPFTRCLPTRATLEMFSKKAMDELRKAQVTEGWDKTLKTTKDKTQVARSFTTVAIMDSVLHALLTYAHLCNIGEIRRETFLELICDMLGTENFSDIEISYPTPFRIARFEHGISYPTERIMIPHASEGFYPRARSERLFFSDSLEFGTKPNSILDAIFPSEELQLAREAYLFHLWLSKARREVIITFPQVDESGSELMSSGFLAEMGPFTAVEAKLPRPSAADAPDFDLKLEERLVIEKERIDAVAAHPEYHGQMERKATRDLIRRRYTNEVFSASRLETYAECPFRFFVEYVLGLKPEEDITREIRPNDRGTIIHTILEHFWRDHAQILRRVIETGKTPTDEIVTVIDCLAEQAFQRHSELIAESSPVLHPFQKRAIKMVVRAVIERELDDAMALSEPLNPRFCEWIFGDTLNNAIKIPIEGDKPSYIQGRVDRIDLTLNSSRFLVVDYKTGKNVASIYQDLLMGRHLQLPIYIEAVRRLLLPQGTPLGGILLAVMTAEKKQGFLKKEYNDLHYSIRKNSKTIFECEDWDAQLNSALKYAGAYIAKIRDGKFGITADDCPRYCKFGDVCRKGGM